MEPPEPRSRDGGPGTYLIHCSSPTPARKVANGIQNCTSPSVAAHRLGAGPSLERTPPPPVRRLPRSAPALHEVRDPRNFRGAVERVAAVSGGIAGNFGRDVLARGYRLGFVGSGDSHDGHPGLPQLAAPSGGLAALFAGGATREDVRAALAARRCYATNGPRIPLEASLAVRPMGSSVPPGDASLHLRVTAPGARVELVRGEEVLALWVFDTATAPRETELDATLPALRPGEAPYPRVVQRDDGAARSSPWFVDAP